MEKQEELRYKALLAEKTERFDEMAGFVKELAGVKKDMDKVDRNLLSVAYKNTISPRRSSWRILNQLEEKERKKGNDLGANSAREYKQAIEVELRNTCEEVLTIIENAPKDGPVDSRVFYLKLTGDYNRYLAEFSEGSSKIEAAQSANKAYSEAVELSQELDKLSPVRLGAILNYSVFLFEISESKEKAIEIAQSALGAADQPQLTDQQTENGLILRLIETNIAQWKTE